MYDTCLLFTLSTAIFSIQFDFEIFRVEAKFLKWQLEYHRKLRSNFVKRTKFLSPSNFINFSQAKRGKIDLESKVALRYIA